MEQALSDTTAGEPAITQESAESFSLSLSMD
jgi:hypothetical protein